MTPKGIANIIPSNLSNKPPCPGKILPVSLIFAFLFSRDINKSPNWFTVDISRHINNRDLIDVKLWNNKYVIINDNR